MEKDLDRVVDEFLSMQTQSEQLLYVWGHSYEMDAEYITWEKFEQVCRKISNKVDIFYGTNKEVLIDE